VESVDPGLAVLVREINAVSPNFPHAGGAPPRGVWGVIELPERAAPVKAA
jgi:hypothetical protein